MPCALKKIRILNFKSFKDISVTLEKFNVVVGPNASGKTNFIEFFKFLKRALAEKHRPYMPYIEWWSYRNIVWQGKEDLPITAELQCDIDDFDVKYNVTFGSFAGTMRIIWEKLCIDDVLVLEREGSLLKVSHSKKFLKEKSVQIKRALSDFGRFFELEKENREQLLNVDNLADYVLDLPADFSSLFSLEIGILPFLSERELSIGYLGGRASPFREKRKSPADQIKSSFVILPKKNIERYPHPLSVILKEFTDALNKFTILKHPNIQGMKSPSSPKETDSLFEDGTNLNNVISNWMLEKQKLPERIEVALRELFLNTQVGVSTTAQGEVFLKVFEKGLELNPPCISDGFYKILLILAAIELKPTLLAIDEIENSLHAESLKYVIDELKASDTTVIVTTHSPVVVDMVKLEDLMVAEKRAEETTLIKIKDPDKVRKKLAELKITQSDSWLYGDLTNGRTLDALM